MPHEPPKKPMSRWLIAAIAVVGLGLLVVGGAFLGVVLLVRSDMTDVDKAAEAAHKAPGAAELRALGCDPAGIQKAHSADASTSFEVYCYVPLDSKISCDDVARTYVKAVSKAPGPFQVEVQLVGTAAGFATRCIEPFAADGTRL